MIFQVVGRNHEVFSQLFWVTSRVTERFSALHVRLPEDGSNQPWDRSLKPGFFGKQRSCNMEKMTHQLIYSQKYLLIGLKKNLGGALKYFFNVHSYLWKKSNLTSIYFRWVETWNQQPERSFSCIFQRLLFFLGNIMAVALLGPWTKPPRWWRAAWWEWWRLST